MNRKEKCIKCRNVMYTQQVSHLPHNMSPAEIFAFVEEHLKPKKYAGILHNRDLKEDNITMAEEHVHIMMQFENARSLNQIAKDLGDSPQYFEKWNGNINNGFAYLIHATNNARHKHQYSCEEVVANFEYVDYIKKEIQKVTKVNDISNAKLINDYLDLIADGVISIKECKEKLSGSIYAKNYDKLKKAHELFLERSAEKLHKEMAENNEFMSVHWFYGETETGKSFLAETLAAASGIAFYKTTTTTDPFQFYQAEQVIILDELRPDMIPYSELLALFDPFSKGKIAVSSRYFNKALSCKTIYITTPYSPEIFYSIYKANHIDTGEQLFRRLSSVIKFDMDFLYNMKYSHQYHKFVPVEKKENKYSRKHQKDYVLDNIFDQIM